MEENKLQQRPPPQQQQLQHLPAEGTGQLHAIASTASNSRATGESSFHKIGSFIKALGKALPAFVEACKEPALINAGRRSGKAIVLVSVLTYSIVWLLLLPLQASVWLLRLLSFGRLELDAASAGAQTLLAKCVHGNPFAQIFLCELTMQSNLHSLFESSLQRLNADAYHQLVALPMITTSKRQKLRTWFSRLATLTPVADAAVPSTLYALVRTVSLIPGFGHVAAALAQYVAMAPRMNRKACIALCATALLPQCAPAAHVLIELWTSAKVLGNDVLKPFTKRVVHPSRRAAFVAAYEHLIVAYMIMPAGLMKVPFAGVVSSMPAYALGAHLVAHILERQGLASLQQEWGHSLEQEADGGKKHE